MDRLNAPTKMDQNYGRSFLHASYSYEANALYSLYEANEKVAAKMSDRNFDPSSQVHSNGPLFYITPFRCIMDIIDLKDGPATPKFWVLVNYITSFG